MTERHGGGAAGGAVDTAAPPSSVDGSWATTALFRKVAHDVVGTAGVARGAVDELARAMGDGAAQHAPMLELARRSLARLDRLARRLRLVAIAQGGSLGARPVPLDLGALVDAGIADAAALDGRKTVALERAASPPVQVAADQELVTGAVAELMSNALRFARKRVQVSVEAREGVAAVVIEDDGPGWPPGFAEALLPLLRDRPGQRGSGVSLPVVAVCATEHGGRLVLEASSLTDAKGQPGARARFELPRV